MADIRLVRPKGSRLWLWSGLLAVIAIGFWAWGTFGRDPTAQDERPAVGAALDFGAERAPVLPVFPAPFDSIAPLSARDLGAFVHLRGTAESSVRRNAVYVRSTDGRRILVRFEPAPAEGTSIPIRAGGSVNVAGYVQKLALAEFQVWMDSLGIRIPDHRREPASATCPIPSSRGGMLCSSGSIMFL